MSDKTVAAKKHIPYEDRMPVMDIRGKNFTTEFKKYHVGDTITLTLTARVTKMVEGGSEYDFYDEDDDAEPNPNKGSASFKVVSFDSHEVKNNKKQSAVESATSKFNRLRKEGKSVSDARALAGI